MLTSRLVVHSLMITAVMVLGGGGMQAETHHVSVDDSGFTPANLTIQAGDTVQWENVDEFDFPHTTISTLPISDPEYWNGTLYSFGDTFSKTFNTPGTYECFDQGSALSGSITVNPATPPRITLSAPKVMGGQFIFDVSGLTPGTSNVLLTSTNLTTWMAISTNLAEADSMTFTNNIMPGIRFFRVAQLP